MRPQPSVLGNSEPVAVGAFFQACLEAGEQSLELGGGAGGELGARSAHPPPGNGAAPTQKFLSHGQPQPPPPPRTPQRQKPIQQNLRFVPAAGCKQRGYRN